jgi:outer membrane protein TolC
MVATPPAPATAAEGIDLKVYSDKNLAQAPPAGAAGPVVRVNLREAIRLALAVSPEVRAQLQAVEAARGKLDQATSAFWPQADILGVFGPSQRARADNDCTPGSGYQVPPVPGGLSCTGIRTADKKTSSPVTGVFGLAGIELVQPLYTFGKLSGYKEAATKGVQVEQARVEERKSNIILKVKELYYGHLLALETRGLLSDLKEQLDKALEKVEKSLESESPTADQVDLYKLRSYTNELGKFIAEAEKGIEVSREALATYLALRPDQRVELDTASLEPEVRQVGRVDVQVSDALRLRPEMAQVRAGIDATQALVQVERSNYFPQFFAALVGAWSGATNRSFIENPFVNDRFSQRGAGLIAGFKLHVDFGITGGKVRSAQAEHLKIVEHKSTAELFIPLQVRKARAELEEARRSMEATREGYLNARKWLVAAVANFDLGIGEAKDMADAVAGYGRLRADNFRSVYNYNLSLANLDHATGRDLELSQ